MKQLWSGFVNLIVRIFNSLGDLAESDRADKLLIAAFVVATLRQMGVNGHFVGFDPASEWPWFRPAEVWSGVFMALLIGIALAYISRRWRKIQPETKSDWLYWSIILMGMIFMLISEVFYMLVYAYAAQRGLLVNEALEQAPGWNLVWNLAVAGVLPVMAILIGLVSDIKVEDTQVDEVHVMSLKDDAMLTLLDMVREGRIQIMPSDLAKRAKVSTSLAAEVVTEAYELGVLKR